MESAVSLIQDRITKNNNEKDEISDTIKALSNKITFIDTVNEELTSVLNEIDKSLEDIRELSKEEFPVDTPKLEEPEGMGPEDIVPEEIAKVLMEHCTVNEKFIEAMQKRLDEKSREYDGENNPDYYKNMSAKDLIGIIYEDTQCAFMCRDNLSVLNIKKICEDVANRCFMLWERLEATNE